MRLCSGGCGSKVPDGVRYCADCKPKPACEDGRTHTAVASGTYDAELDKLNTCKRWAAVRKRVICRDPICKRCGLRLSEIVDHIVPADVAIAQARTSGKFPFDRYAGYFLMTNLQGLCRPCHGLKTNEDKAHDAEWPNVVEKELAAPKKVWTFA